MLRKILVVGLIFMLALGLTGIVLAEITIRHWQTDVPVKIEWVERIAADFEQKHPGVKIEPEYIPCGNMAEKCMIAIASDTMPDTLHEYIGRIGSYYRQGAVASLSGTLSEEDLADYVSSVLDLCTIDGDLFAYPWVFGTRTFGANMVLLERAGVADLVPSGENLEWLLGDLEVAMEKVSQLEGVYGTGFFAGTPYGDYHTLGIFQMFGAYLYQGGDYTKTTLNSEDGVRAFEWMNDLVDRGIAAPGPAGTVDDHHVEAFWSGKYGFGGWVPTPEQVQGNYDNGMIDYVAEYRLLEFPHEEGVPAPPVFIGPDVGCVFKSAEEKEIAVEWIKALNTAEAIGLYLEMTPGGLISGRKSLIIEGEFPATLQRMVNKNGVGDLGFTSPFYNQVRDIFIAEMQAGYSRMKTPKKALDDFAESLQRLWQD